MKQSLTIFLLSLVVLLGSAACNKTPLDEAHHPYAGYWEAADGTWVQIYLDGGADMEMSRTSIEGGSVTFSEGQMTIGLFGMDKTFTITEPPKQLENGDWIMVLDGITYVKM